MSVDDLIDTFDLLGDWDARYDFITELGEKAAGLPAELRNPDNQVHGCMSQVWIVGAPAADDPQRMYFRVDGEAPIVRGLAMMLASIYSGLTPAEVDRFDADALFERLGLYDHLSPNRHVGMYAMVEKIKAISRGASTAVH